MAPHSTGPAALRGKRTSGTNQRQYSRSPAEARGRPDDLHRGESVRVARPKAHGRGLDAAAAAAGTVEPAAAAPPERAAPSIRTKERDHHASPALTTSYWPADTSAPVLDTTIGGVLRAAAERAPDQPALVAGDPDPARRRQWSYGQLLAEAERAAHALLARFQPGDPVAVWSGNCPEWVLLEFAAGLAGLTLVTVNPAYQAESSRTCSGTPARRDLPRRRVPRQLAACDPGRRCAAGCPGCAR